MVRISQSHNDDGEENPPEWEPSPSFCLSRLGQRAFPSSPSSISSASRTSSRPAPSCLESALPARAQYAHLGLQLDEAAGRSCPCIPATRTGGPASRPRPLRSARPRPAPCARWPRSSPPSARTTRRRSCRRAPTSFPESAAGPRPAWSARPGCSSCAWPLRSCR